MPVPYTSDGIQIIAAVLKRLLNRAAGGRAPKRKRRRRVQKRIDKRRGHLHYGIIYFDGDVLTPNP